MIKPKEHFHGSDLEKIEAIYGIKKENITSFSANVNPLGISPKLKQTLVHQIDAITGYPDREYTSLRKSIATYVQGDMDTILVGNGSTELISLFIQMINPKKALILAPTYSEYEREITLNGGICTHYYLKEEHYFHLDTKDLEQHLTSDIELLVICNPNNPTSTSISVKQMEEILTLCRGKQIYCMVDETYVEFTSEIHEVTSVPLIKTFDNLIILRGISKFFAAPGLRLGYAICGNPSLLAEVNKKKNPWTINTLAAIAGEIMFSDTDYITQTKNLIHTERTRIYDILSTCKNVKIYPPTANFVLVKILKDSISSDQIFDCAIKDGLMIRDCSSFEGLDNSFIRFCFMEPEMNTKLLHLLLEILNCH